MPYKIRRSLLHPGRSQRFFVPTRRRAARGARVGRYAKGKFAARVYNVVRKVAEKKVADELSEDSVSPANVGGPIENNLVSIGQGDTIDSRQGNVINVSAIYLRFFMEGIKRAATTSNNTLRIVLLLDKHSNGSIPAWGDVFQFDGTSTTQRGMSAPLKKSDLGRFTILMDRVYTFSSGGIESRFVKYYKRLKKPLQVRYDGSATVPEKNGLYLLFNSDQDSGTAAEQPRVNWYSRIRYTDG